MTFFGIWFWVGLLGTGAVLVFLFRMQRRAEKKGREETLQEIDNQVSDLKRQSDEAMNAPRDEDTVIDDLEKGKF